MKEDVSVSILHLEMSWCLFLCHWFKLASMQGVKGLGFFDGKVGDVDVAKQGEQPCCKLVRVTKAADA